MGPKSRTPCSNASNYEEDDKNWGRKGVRKVLGLKKELVRFRLPTQNGVTCCEKVRARSCCPIL